ncbi:HD domain-containing phosphohydrolase [Natranaerofaba carboxydovora]|uniref:HD domain-containing phosphohydrolase n=1 Tax=Natranaerofaba carboxydovora TaxID=2742683 RepID=UPI001F13197A|nr:HD domain-containing phosphohydrolase [Natranaerofaba carboxydovora]UMZ75486.1 3'3'-cGAMP-specific phosphodiesterase 1 [Natranaerofaba carboxydovora]
MPGESFNVSLFDLTMCLSDAMDLISPVVVDHHKKVALIADYFGEEMGLSKEKQTVLTLAGLLHDSGAISLKERIDALTFELENPHKHSELGYLMLKGFPFYSEIATIIRYHHSSYKEYRTKVPFESHIVHLADRISVLINPDKQILEQKDYIIEKINDKKGDTFAPEIVEAFEKVSEKESFWLDIVSPDVGEILSSRAKSNAASISLDINGLLEIGELFTRVIDFRSVFTSTHSSGVAASAEALARKIGFSDLECLQMRLAGYLHDLGKLAVPKEILEKPGKLTEDEFRVIRTHTYYTYRTLERLPQLETINKWGALHHEKIDGSGYPFHCEGEKLSLGSRIVAVADVFTALTEDRPYREGLSPQKVEDILNNMVKEKALDSGVVEVLMKNYKEIDDVRKNAQLNSKQKYQDTKEKETHAGG